MCSALVALCRLKAHEYNGNPDLSDELETARGVEQSLLAQLEEEREVAETVRHELEASLCACDILQTDNDRLSAALLEEKTAINNFRQASRTSLLNAVESLHHSRVVEADLLSKNQENERKYKS